MNIQRPISKHPIPPHARMVFKMVFKGVIFDVFQWQQEMFDGSVQTFEKLKRPDIVNVIPAVFVAGWFTLMNLNGEEKNIAAPWLTTPVDFEKIKTHCKVFMAIFSDDDTVVPLDNIETFKRRLGTMIVVEHAKGHFSGDDDITKLPSVLESVLTIQSNVSRH